MQGLQKQGTDGGEGLQAFLEQGATEVCAIVANEALWLQ